MSDGTIIGAELGKDRENGSRNNQKRKHHYEQKIVERRGVIEKDSLLQNQTL
jgi:hypothetical protein